MSREAEDFGFSLSFVDEDELRALEKELAQKNTSLEKEAVTYQDKYESLQKMIMVLMKNLLQEPTKNYIHWPDRVKDVEEFIKKINSL